ncbi:MAG TPA: DUF309 domain-containing protein [Verrucomicrobiae bacterium]|jgi:predicted metal-dependent hydrolase
MSKKSGHIAELIASCQGRELDAHYLGYFECFNRQLFYEAHDVLEELWLTQRHGPNDGFYKGLIQFAGAFVHLQKNRLGPAAALLRLSRKYLSGYPATHERLKISMLLGYIDDWLKKLASDGGTNPLQKNAPPVLEILNTV